MALASEAAAGGSQAVVARVIDAGDSAPYIHSADQDGNLTASNADLISGKPVLLLFCPLIEDEASGAGLRTFGAAAAKLDALKATVMVISRGSIEDNKAVHERLALPFAILTDGKSEIHKAYGVDPQPAVASLTLYILDAGHRVTRVLERMDAPAMVAEMMAELERLNAARPAVKLQMHPPVLVLPRMLSVADCAYLAEIWHHQVPEYGTDGFTNAGSKAEAGDYKVVHDGAYGRAVEYIVQDRALQRFIDQRMRRRLLPEIKKAFQAAGLKREGYRIAGYEAQAGGYLNPHRDNSTPANAHRRFTMTINLNAGEYDGGQLRFREYGEQLYEVERGTAIVWSASLLHEVLPVTKGRRLVLGVHMFGTDGQAPVNNPVSR